jgi:hypothetical protein
MLRMTGWVKRGPEAISAQCPDYPKAAGQASLFDHLVGAGEQRRWHFEAECAGGRQIND